MAAISTEAEKNLQYKKEHKKRFRRGQRVLFSFDNASIHESAMEWRADRSGLMQMMGFKREQRIPLSPYSPDLHRTIERAHARATTAFHKYLYANPSVNTISEYKFHFERIFKDVNNAAVIAADVSTLPELYHWVHAHNGEWPPAAMR